MLQAADELRINSRDREVSQLIFRLNNKHRLIALTNSASYAYMQEIFFEVAAEIYIYMPNSFKMLRYAN